MGGQGIPIMRANWVKSVSGGQPALKKRSPCTCTKVSQARKMDWRRCGTSLGTQLPADQLARTRLEISMAFTRGLAPLQLSSETEGRLHTTRRVSHWCRDRHLGRMPRLFASLGLATSHQFQMHQRTRLCLPAGAECDCRIRIFTFCTRWCEGCCCETAGCCSAWPDADCVANQSSAANSDVRIEHKANRHWNFKRKNASEKTPGFAG